MVRLDLGAQAREVEGEGNESVLLSITIFLTLIGWRKAKSPSVLPVKLPLPAKDVAMHLGRKNLNEIPKKTGMISF